MIRERSCHIPVRGWYTPSIRGAGKADGNRSLLVVKRADGEGVYIYRKAAGGRTTAGPGCESNGTLSPDKTGCMRDSSHLSLSLACTQSSGRHQQAPADARKSYCWDAHAASLLFHWMETLQREDSLPIHHQSYLVRHPSVWSCSKSH